MGDRVSHVRMPILSVNDIEIREREKENVRKLVFCFKAIYMLEFDG